MGRRREPKPCLYCKLLFWPKKPNNWYGFGAKKYCGSECAIAAQKQRFVPMEKKCRGCDTILVRTPLQGEASFGYRKYCSVACSVAKQRREFYETGGFVLFGIRCSVKELALAIGVSGNKVRTVCAAIGCPQ
jgi:hypothetical protein